LYKVVVIAAGIPDIAASESPFNPKQGNLHRFGTFALTFTPNFQL
jgi:hypothetical protein